LNQQARADQQHEGQRDLPNHQHAEHAAPGARERHARGLLQCAMSFDADGVERRSEAEEDRRSTDDRDAEEHEAEVHAEFDPARDIVGHQRDQGAQADLAQGHAENAASDGEHAAFGEEMAYDARARRAQRHADGELPGARLSAHQHQAGDVDAGDEQQNGDSAKQDVSDGLEIAQVAVAQRLQDGRGVFIDGLGFDEGLVKCG